MKKKIIYAALYGICGIVLVIALLAAALFVWAVYDELSEKPLVRENLLEEDVELDIQGDDIQALVGETEALLRLGEAGWELGRTVVGQERSSRGTMEYIAVYLYYRQKDGTYRQEDGTESVHRMIRLLKEDGRWIVTEAYERNEEVYMDGTLSGSMLEEILGLAEEQISLNYPGYDGYDINMTSGAVGVTVYRKDEGGESMTAKRLSFRVRGAETKYRLEEVTAHPD